MKVKNKNIKIKILKGAELTASALVNGKTTTTSLIERLEQRLLPPRLPVGTGKIRMKFMDIARERGICLYNPLLGINHFAVELSQPNAQTQLIPAQYSYASFQQKLFSVSQTAAQDSDYVLVDKDNDDDYELIDATNLRK